MSNPQITKTVLFSVPTEWMGDTDPDEVGIATYTGPRYIQTCGILKHQVWIASLLESLRSEQSM